MDAATLKRFHKETCRNAIKKNSLSLSLSLSLFLSSSFLFLFFFVLNWEDLRMVFYWTFVRPREFHFQTVFDNKSQ